MSMKGLARAASKRGSRPLKKEVYKATSSSKTGNRSKTGNGQPAPALLQAHLPTVLTERDDVFRSRVKTWNVIIRALQPPSHVPTIPDGQARKVIGMYQPPRWDPREIILRRPPYGEQARRRKELLQATLGVRERTGGYGAGDELTAGEDFALRPWEGHTYGHLFDQLDRLFMYIKQHDSLFENGWNYLVSNLCLGHVATGKLYGYYDMDTRVSSGTDRSRSTRVSPLSKSHDVPVIPGEYFFFLHDPTKCGLGSVNADHFPFEDKPCCSYFPLVPRKRNLFKEPLSQIRCSSEETFKKNVRRRDGRCVVSGADYGLGDVSLLSGPIQAAHVVPNSLPGQWTEIHQLAVASARFKNAGAGGEGHRFLTTLGAALNPFYVANNAIENGLMLRSDLHYMHDMFLWGLLPDRKRVVLFAPLGNKMQEYAGVSVEDNSDHPEWLPPGEVLHWHYDVCWSKMLLADPITVPEVSNGRPSTLNGVVEEDEAILDPDDPADTDPTAAEATELDEESMDFEKEGRDDALSSEEEEYEFTSTEGEKEQEREILHSIDEDIHNIDSIESDVQETKRVRSILSHEVEDKRLERLLQHYIGEYGLFADKELEERSELRKKRLVLLVSFVNSIERLLKYLANTGPRAVVSPDSLAKHMSILERLSDTIRGYLEDLEFQKDRITSQCETTDAKQYKRDFATKAIPLIEERRANLIKVRDIAEPIFERQRLRLGEDSESVDQLEKEIRAFGSNSNKSSPKPTDTFDSPDSSDITVSSKLQSIQSRATTEREQPKQSEEAGEEELPREEDVNLSLRRKDLPESYMRFLEYEIFRLTKKVAVYNTKIRDQQEEGHPLRETLLSNWQKRRELFLSTIDRRMTEQLYLQLFEPKLKSEASRDATAQRDDERQNIYKVTSDIGTVKGFPQEAFIEEWQRTLLVLRNTLKDNDAQISKLKESGDQGDAGTLLSRSMVLRIATVAVDRQLEWYSKLLNRKKILLNSRWLKTIEPSLACSPKVEDLWMTDLSSVTLTEEEATAVVSRVLDALDNYMDDGLGVENDTAPFFPGGKLSNWDFNGITATDVSDPSTPSINEESLGAEARDSEESNEVEDTLEESETVAADGIATSQERSQGFTEFNFTVPRTEANEKAETTKLEAAISNLNKLSLGITPYFKNFWAASTPAATPEVDEKANAEEATGTPEAGTEANATDSVPQSRGPLYDKKTPSTAKLPPSEVQATSDGSFTQDIIRLLDSQQSASRLDSDETPATLTKEQSKDEGNAPISDEVLEIDAVEVLKDDREPTKSKGWTSTISIISWWRTLRGKTEETSVPDAKDVSEVAEASPTSSDQPAASNAGSITQDDATPKQDSAMRTSSEESQETPTVGEVSTNIAENTTSVGKTIPGGGALLGGAQLAEVQSSEDEPTGISTSEVVALPMEAVVQSTEPEDFNEVILTKEVEPEEPGAPREAQSPETSDEATRPIEESQPFIEASTDSTTGTPTPSTQTPEFDQQSLSQDSISSTAESVDVPESTQEQQTVEQEKYAAASSEESSTIEAPSPSESKTTKDGTVKKAADEKDRGRSETSKLFGSIFGDMFRNRS